MSELSGEDVGGDTEVAASDAKFTSGIALAGEPGEEETDMVKPACPGQLVLRLGEALVGYCARRGDEVSRLRVCLMLERAP